MEVEVVKRGRWRCSRLRWWRGVGGGGGGGEG